MFVFSNVKNIVSVIKAIFSFLIQRFIDGKIERTIIKELKGSKNLRKTYLVTFQNEEVSSDIALVKIVTLG